jgi:3',5'-cyclic-AMP phosphodiesterase
MGRYSNGVPPPTYPASTYPAPTYPMPNSPLLIAQLTDTHLFADGRQEMLGCRTNSSFASVIAAIAQLQPRPDLLLLTGDLSQDETQESYLYLRSRLDPLQIPTYWIPGNHDQGLSDMEQVLNSAIISTAKEFQQGSWNFILLNTMMLGKVQGRLSIAELTRLEQQLQEHFQPALVLLHHPPLPVGAACMDKIRLENSGELFAILDRFPHVKIVLFGHIHHATEQLRGNVRYIGTPSTCVQLKPGSEVFTIDDQPPGFRLLRLYPDGQYETEVRRVAIASPQP